jgi:hypothetical protein
VRSFEVPRDQRATALGDSEPSGRGVGPHSEAHDEGEGDDRRDHDERAHHEQRDQSTTM